MAPGKFGHAEQEPKSSKWPVRHPVHPAPVYAGPHEDGADVVNPAHRRNRGAEHDTTAPDNSPGVQNPGCAHMRSPPGHTAPTGHGTQLWPDPRPHRCAVATSRQAGPVVKFPVHGRLTKAPPWPAETGVWSPGHDGGHATAAPNPLGCSGGFDNAMGK